MASIINHLHEGAGTGIITTGGIEDAAFGVVLCKHCQKMMKTGVGFDDRSGWCKKCDAFICAGCVGKVCAPWEKQMEEKERTLKQRLWRLFCLRSYGV